MMIFRNLVHEQDADVEEIFALGFGYCQLVVAVPNDSSIDSPEQLLSSRIATSYPESARKFFKELGGNPEIVTISGSVEVAPALGVADAIVELTATGSSLQLNDLRSIHTVMESEAVLIANKKSMADPVKRENIERLLLRVRAVDAASKYKYIMMNAPESALADIRAVLPGLKAPTVVPLADPGWVAVHTAIKEDEFWEKIEQLRAAGASEILVSSLDKFLL
jgi:ATP phosphoribosyltransferase